MPTRRIVRGLAVPFLLLAALSAQEPKRLTFRQVSGEERAPSFAASLPVAWAKDGASVYVGRGPQAKLVDPKTGAEKPAGPGDAPQPGSGGGPGRRGRGEGGRTAPRLEVKDARLVDRSPDFQRAAFVRGHDLWVCDHDGKSEKRLTEDGGEDLYHGELDWVYQEEVYGRGQYRAHWWSPDSARLAYLSLTVKDVPRFPLVDWRPTRPELTLQRYPKVGQPNPAARLSVASVADGKSTPVSLSDYPSDALIVHVGWRPDSARVVFMVQDRLQTWLDLCDADPATGERRRLVREESPDWVERPNLPRWLDDGTFLWQSHRTGYDHLYRYDRDGKLLHTLTGGEWEVRDIAKLDEKAGWLVFSASKDGAVNRNYYKVALTGGDIVRLTKEPGTHQLTFNADNTLAIDTWSTLCTPSRACVIDLDGNVVRDLGAAEAPTQGYALSRWELVEIPARDGYVLDAAILPPVGAKPGQKHPVWLPTYSGPNAPSVRNAWSGAAFEQFLAQQGMLVLQVNVRSASGRGHCHAAKAYKQLGVPELRDLEDAVAWVCKERGGDPERVGITGWSYGGFMAAYALLASKAFKLGIAGAGVYDWRLYDSIYTERYMRLADESDNKAGYDATSCVLGAKNLHGHLVLMHGMDDDNVHVQNTVQLVNALQQANKDFELMLFPGAMHGVGGLQGQQRQRIVWRVIREHLLDLL